MLLRDLPSNFSRGIVADIDARLAAVGAEQGVSIPLAVESGSRAWGFPSPDSDYDCRFIFVRPIDQYLSPWQQRDVIETPLESDLDVNGWELGKALKLLLKGNAVIIEWLRSPIIYRGDAQFREEFLAFATQFANRDLVGRHYLHLGERQRRTYFSCGKAVPQKKIFYALRPAAALRWLRLHPGQAVAPMHFATLMAESDFPGEVTDVILDLMMRKAVSRELGTAPLPESIAKGMGTAFDASKCSPPHGAPVAGSRRA
jgi:uncharacterized protein